MIQADRSRIARKDSAAQAAAGRIAGDRAVPYRCGSACEDSRGKNTAAVARHAVPADRAGIDRQHTLVDFDSAAAAGAVGMEGAAVERERSELDINAAAAAVQRRRVSVDGAARDRQGFGIQNRAAVAGNVAARKREAAQLDNTILVCGAFIDVEDAATISRRSSG